MVCSKKNFTTSDAAKLDQLILRRLSGCHVFAAITGSITIGTGEKYKGIPGICQPTTPA